MRVLVVGASGTVGGAVLGELRRRGADVRALARRPHTTCGPDDGACGAVEWIVGDLADGESVRRALVDVDAAFYVSPHAEDEVDLAATFVAEARRAEVRVVFAGVHVSTGTIGGWWRHRAFRLLFPAYRPKLEIGRSVERALPGAVLLVPTNFYDNDEVFLPDILDGRFPTPLRGVNRVAVSDVAAAAARALLDPGVGAGTYPVCGPRSLTGPESAAIWGRVLGRPVRYTGDDPAEWRRVADRRLPGGAKGRDWRASFALLGRLRLPTRTADVARTRALLGRDPVEYEDWVRECAASASASTSASRHGSATT